MWMLMILSILFLYDAPKIEKKIGGTVIGIDEVGRGPLAGPVVSCACIFFDYSIEQAQLSLFDDSKKLTIKKRCEAFHKVYQLKNENKLRFSLGFANVIEIDKFNILEAEGSLDPFKLLKYIVPRL